MPLGAGGAPEDPPRFLAVDGLLLRVRRVELDALELEFDHCWCPPLPPWGVNGDDDLVAFPPPPPLPARGAFCGGLGGLAALSLPPPEPRS